MITATGFTPVNGGIRPDKSLGSGINSKKQKAEN
jgi:hypothetical protein